MKTKSEESVDDGMRERPSLYGGTSAKSAEIFSILDALEPRRHRRTMLWWRAGLVGMATLLAGALYMVGGNVDVRSYLSPAAPGDVTLDRTVIRRAPRVLPALAASASSTSAAQSAPAAIVDEPPLQHAEVQASEATSKTVPAETAVSSSVDAQAKAAGSAPPSKVVVRKANSAPGAGAREHPHTEALAISKPESKPARQAVTKTAPKAGRDRDVELIAALVSHVSNGESAAADNRKKPTKMATDATTAEASQRRKKRAEANREVVMRSDEESTATLVRRCRSLGLIEGELCRLRICSGLWGTDPACPGSQPQQP